MVDYQTMSAGDELNAAVAEKVMGWKLDTATPFATYWAECDGGRRRCLEAHWHPAIDPRACHEMLVHIRKTWSDEEKVAFAAYLFTMDYGRLSDSYKEEAEADPCGDVYLATIHLDPADYARAALMTKENSDGDS